MDERVQELEQLLRFEVTDAERAQGRYVWEGPEAWPDAQVVAFLVNYYRTASSAMDDLQAVLHRTGAELAELRDRYAELAAQLATTDTEPEPSTDLVLLPDADRG